METINIDSLNLKELKELLKELKLYNNLTKQLWDRWREKFENQKKWKKSLMVEYFPSISEEVAFLESKKIFKNIFWIDVEKEDLKFKENSNIKWWMRFYLDDKVLDLSYLKIERNLSK